MSVKVSEIRKVEQKFVLQYSIITLNSEDKHLRNADNIFIKRNSGLKIHDIKKIRNVALIRSKIR